MKDYLTYQDISDIQECCDAICKAFHIGLIIDGQGCLYMVNNCILSVHSYNEASVTQIIEKIYRTYFLIGYQFEQEMVVLYQNNQEGLV